MLTLSKKVSIPLEEIEFQAIRAQGTGGQNVNKVATAIHLRLDISSSSLPASYQEKLRMRQDSRISKDGVIVIKAGRYRSQEKNKEDALMRLKDLIQKVMHPQKKRKATKPTKGSQKKRLDKKNNRGKIKSLRGQVDSRD